MHDYETTVNLLDLISIIGWLGLTVSLAVLGFFLYNISKNIRELSYEVKWMINKLKGIEPAKEIPVKKKRGRPPKKK